MHIYACIRMNKQITEAKCLCCSNEGVLNEFELIACNYLIYTCVEMHVKRKSTET